MRSCKARDDSRDRRLWASVLSRMGFSVYWIARFLGVSRSTVYRYLRNQSRNAVNHQNQNRYEGE
jgi:predicted transcriptional regulator